MSSTHFLSEPQNKLQKGMRLHQEGQLVAAERIYRQLLPQMPNHAELWHLLGLACAQQGKQSEAGGYFQKAIGLNPNHAIYHHNLGEVYRLMHQPEAAMAAYRQALHLEPDFAEAHFNLATLLRQQERLEEAVAHYRQALQKNPQHFKAFYNLGNCYLAMGHFRSAISCYRAAIALKSDFFSAYNNLGVALKELEQLPEAVELFKKVLDYQPNNKEAWHNLAQTLEKQGEFAQAKHYYAAFLQEPDGWEKLYLEGLYPAIIPDQADVDDYWRRVQQRLELCLAEDRRETDAYLEKLSLIPPSIMAYHGQEAEEKQLKERWARLIAGTFPPIPSRPLRHPIRPHIGFVVTHGHEGVFLKCMRGLINQLSGKQFRLTLVCSQQAGQEILRPHVHNPDVQFLPIPSAIDKAAEQLRMADFDILHYWEVGTDQLNYRLPFYELATVQCACWGWPVTTGIPQIGYYLSAEGLETAESDQFYTERLIRFRYLPTYYYRPIVPAQLQPRAVFGYSKHDHLYLCVQNLRKIHPQMDAVFADLLRRDPAGRLLFIEDAQPAITNLLHKRFAKQFPDVLHRVRFMPRQAEGGYLNLIAIADLVLDSFHYGGGANTTFDAMAVGTPIVSCPGRFQRSRWVYAVYRELGIDDGLASIPEEYGQMALEIGNDPDRRHAFRQQIQETASTLFENQQAVDELATFFAHLYNHSS